MCEYCSNKQIGKKITDMDDAEGNFMFLSRQADGTLLCCEMEGKDPDGYKPTDFFPIKYCPMCGKKLKRWHPPYSTENQIERGDQL